MSTPENPYAATPEPDSPVDDPELVEARRLRRRYVRREAFIRSVGLLYYLFAFVSAISLWMAVSRTQMPMGMVYDFVPRVFWMYVVLGVIMLTQIVTGWGLRQLAGWARVPATFFSILGLFSFPVGTIAHVVILYLIFSPAAWTVFSREYHDVIEQTREIRYARWKIFLCWVGGFAVLALAKVVADAVS